MNLKQFFDKQTKHWNDLVENSPTLFHLDWKDNRGTLNAYADLSTNDANFVVHNSTFLCSMTADNDARNLNSEIAEYLAGGNGINLILKVNYTNGNYDIVSYEVLQGIARDDNESQLKNPDGMILICARPKFINSYQKPVPCDEAVCNKNSVSVKNDLNDYLNDIRSKAKNMADKGGNYSYSFSMTTDENGKTVVNHSFNGAEYTTKEFINGKSSATKVEAKEDVKPTEEQQPNSLSSALERFKKMLG